MAIIKLIDGREVPVVKPHLGDQMELERQMRASNPKYGPAEFREDMKISAFQTAFALFASFNRAGERVTIKEILELDLEKLSTLVQLEDGDAPEEASADDGSEGEQSADPTHNPTAEIGNG